MSMSLVEALYTGLNLAVVGMGLVFLLLAVLWALLTVMLRMDRAPATEAASAAVTEAPATIFPEDEADALDPDLRAAIAVAVLTHQAVLRKQAAPTMRSHWPGSLLYASRWVAAGRHQQIENWHPRKH
jgi:glutaconyl-CoA/methylmalonyl-CoA decarboxylase subunit delta